MAKISFGQDFVALGMNKRTPPPPPPTKHPVQGRPFTLFVPITQLSILGSWLRHLPSSTSPTGWYK